MKRLIGRDKKVIQTAMDLSVTQNTDDDATETFAESDAATTATLDRYVSSCYSTIPFASGTRPIPPRSPLVP